MEELALAILLAALGFLLRALFVLGRSTDEWMTWWLIHQQRDRPLHYGVRGSLIEGEFGYARLQYLLLSRLPQRLWGPLGNLSNVLYDCAAIAMVWVLAAALLATHGLDAPVAGLAPAVWVALLFATMPILMPPTGRLTGIKSRTLGALLSLVYFACLGGAWGGTSAWLYAAAVASGVLVVLSSAMALQNIAFVSLCLSLFTLDPVPFAVFLATLGVGVLLPGAGVRTVLRFKWIHYRWYLQNYQGTGASERNRPRDLLRLPRLLRERPMEFLNQVFRRQTLLILLHSAPALFVLLALLLGHPDLLGELKADPVTRYCAGIVAATLVVVLLTSTRPLLFLGQSERYFEYAAPYLALLVVVAAVRTEASPGLLIGLLLFQVTSVLASFCTVMVREFVAATRPVSSPGDSELVEFLKELPGELRILTIPIKYGWALASRIEDPRVRFYHMFVAGPGGNFDYMNRDLARYSWPRPDLEHFRDSYGVNTIVVRKQEAEDAARGGLAYPLREEDRLFENGTYAVYRLPEADPSA